MQDLICPAFFKVVPAFSCQRDKFSSVQSFPLSLVQLSEEKTGQGKAGKLDFSFPLVRLSRFPSSVQLSHWSSRKSWESWKAGTISKKRAGERKSNQLDKSNPPASACTSYIVAGAVAAHNARSGSRILVNYSAGCVDGLNGTSTAGFAAAEALRWAHRRGGWL